MTQKDREAIKKLADRLKVLAKKNPTETKKEEMNSIKEKVNDLITDVMRAMLNTKIYPYQYYQLESSVKKSLDKIFKGEE